MAVPPDPRGNGPPPPPAASFAKKSCRRLGLMPPPGSAPPPSSQPSPPSYAPAPPFSAPAMAHEEDPATPMALPLPSSLLQMSGRPSRKTTAKRKGRPATVLLAAPPPPSSVEHQVFDEMATSVVGDGSFMSMMVDDDVEVMDDEGFIDPFPSKGRQMNYTIQEDETLVLAWEAITLDAIHGVEQSGSIYWQRIHEHYHQIKKTSGDRTQKSLTNRWSAIQDTCSKWASAMEQVERFNPSGTNQNDRINIAQKYFRQLTSKNGKLGKPFNVQHCYALLLHDEKWRSRNDEVPNKKSKSASNSYSLDVENIGDSSDESAEDAKRSPTPNSVEIKRPLGRKKEKARLKEKEGTCKDSIEMIMATKKSLAAERKEEKAQTFMQIKGLEERRIAFEAHRVQLEERRIAIEERREKSRQEKREHQLMFMNSSNLDDQGKAYLKLMRDQIMASKTMGGFMPSFFMGGGGGMGDGGGMGGGGGMGDGGGTSG